MVLTRAWSVKKENLIWQRVFPSGEGIEGWLGAQSTPSQQMHRATPALEHALEHAFCI